MPEYHYKCSECEHEFTKICSISEHTSELPCEKCEKPANQLLGPSNFRLKGKGWYETMHKCPLKQKNIYRKN